MQIGFIGLGSMGAAIARNLLESGHDLCVFNRSPARAEPLRNAGATVAASPAQAAHSADVVFTMVADDAALASVTFGETGIVAGLKPGALHISMSTIGMATAQAFTIASSRCAREASVPSTTCPHSRMSRWPTRDWPGTTVSRRFRPVRRTGTPLRARCGCTSVLPGPSRAFAAAAGSAC
jgi:hypothetical protein